MTTKKYPGLNFRPDGPPIELLPRKFNKTLLNQPFVNDDTGERREMILFDAGPTPSIVLPLTADLEVVAVRQFSGGAGKITLELPGGNSKNPNATSEETAREELLDETGYQAEELIFLYTKSWFDPCNYVIGYNSFLARNCRPVAKPREKVEVELIPLKRRINLALYQIKDSKSVVTTFRALPLLGIDVFYHP